MSEIEKFKIRMLQRFDAILIEIDTPEHIRFDVRMDLQEYFRLIEQRYCEAVDKVIEMFRDVEKLDHYCACECQEFISIDYYKYQEFVKELLKLKQITENNK